MHESLNKTVAAKVSISDSGCRRIYSRHWVQETLYQTVDAGVSAKHWVQKVDSISDRGCKRHYIKQQVHASLTYIGCRGLIQTADAGNCRRQLMHESVYQTVNAGVCISDRGCRSLYIRQRMQESVYQTEDAGDYI